MSTPYDPPSAPVASAVPQPPTSVPQTLGVLNILFGALLILCGLGCGFSAVSMAFSGPMMQGMQVQMKQQMEAQRQTQIERLEEQLAEAETEEERVRLEERIDRMHTQVMPIMDMAAMYDVYREPGMIAYYIGDFGTMLVLNVLLLVSGCGLLKQRAWAWKLAWWTGWIKIVRLVLVEGAFVIFIVPMMAQSMEDFMQSVIAADPDLQPGQGPPAGTMGMVYSVTYTAMAVVTVLLGIIYPIVMLWLLKKPAVVAACGVQATRGDATLV